ncbi:alanine racemase [Thermogymnomonas acidicola]|uniref:alanine racemase n=1 Tax=Thermogymnomonas acidicola TaxID=399579 RepID=UPI0013969743|nr:alanine racemase [Thermogymnomonas acidicola]
MHRCGVEPEKAVGLAMMASRGGQNVYLAGVMAYDGHVNDPDREKRKQMVEAEASVLQKVIASLDIEPDTVSVGGTPTYELWAGQPVCNELQPGTYVYYDVHCQAMGLCSREQIAMGVVSRVISRSESPPPRAVLDAGYKSVSLDQGVYPPTAVDASGQELRILSMSEEHCVIDNASHALDLDDAVLLFPPYHSCTTTDLWDTALLYSRSSAPPRQVPVAGGRGKRL